MDLKTLVEKLLNDVIEVEFEKFIGASLYKRTAERNTHNGTKIYRNGYRTRKLNTTFGTITLRIPRTNKVPFLPSFIERYKRNTTELNHLIQQMYINGVSTAKVNKCVKVLGIDNISKSQVSRITDALKTTITTQDLYDKQYNALYIDATYEKVRVQNKVRLCAMITILGYTKNGNDIIAVYPMPDESKKSYSMILNDLKWRGLNAPQLIISDCAIGLLNAMKEIYPETKYQRCKVHFMRNIFRHLSNKAKQMLKSKIKHIWHTSNFNTAMERAKYLYNKYRRKYPLAMKCLMDGIQSTLTYTLFDDEYLQHKRIETTNPIERINREFKRRTKVISVFSSVASCYKLYSLMSLSNAINQ